MNIIENLFRAFFNIHDNIFKFRTERLLKRQNKLRKQHLSGECYVTIESMAEKERETMESEITATLKSLQFEPDRIINYLKGQNVSVNFIICNDLLDFIGEKPGFIYPQKGFKALYLSMLTGGGIKFNTEAMFVFSKNNIDKYYLIYHFYNWCAYKRGVYGVDAYSINILNQYLFPSSKESIKKLSLSEIYILKDAIKQDKAAIDFLIKLCRDDEGARNAFDKLKDSGAEL